MELTPRKIDKPKHSWLPAYYGGWCSPAWKDDKPQRDTFSASYRDENDKSHMLIDDWFVDEYAEDGFGHRDCSPIIMLSYLCHLYEIEVTPELKELARRILEKPYGWTICKLERKELILLVEKHTHIQKEMFA